MSKLTDTQLVVLTAACQRDDACLFPITAKLAGGALAKVLNALVNKGLAEEIEGAADGAIWRVADDGMSLSLRATPAAFEALGIEQEEPAECPIDDADRRGAEETPAARTVPLLATKPAKPSRRATQAKKPTRPAQPPAAAEPGPVASGAARGQRQGTKQAALIEMLRRPEGATVPEIMTTTGWLAHTVRGAIAGALKKKLGLVITSEKIVGRGRAYRIP